MLFQRFIVKTYASFVRRISSVIVPFSLLLLLFSALGFKGWGIFRHFSYITQTYFHLYGGVILMVGLVLLGYDTLLKSKGRKRAKIKALRHFSLSPKEVVNYLFYGGLMLLCLSGGILYVEKYHYGFFHLYKLQVMVMHELLGFSLLSLALVKYYLTITRWYRQLIAYLKGC